VHHLMHRKLFVFIGVVASWLCVEGCGLGTGTRDAERKESAIAVPVQGLPDLEPAQSTY